MFGIVISASCVKLVTKCPRCHDLNELTVPLSEWQAYQGGQHIQNALTSLNNSQREQIVTGYDQKCWDAIFCNDNED